MKKMACVSELDSVWYTEYTYGICSFESTKFHIFWSSAALFIVSCNDKEMDCLRINESHTYQMYMEMSAFVLHIIKTPLGILVRDILRIS